MKSLGGISAIALVCGILALFINCAGQYDGEDLSVVTEVALTGLFSPPVIGESPVDQSIDTAQYTGTVSWLNRDYSKMAAEDIFQENTIYHASVKLTPKPGWRFVGLGVNSFSYNYAKAISKPHSGDVIVTFKGAVAIEDNSHEPAGTVEVKEMEEDGPGLSGGGAPTPPPEGTGSVTIQFWENGNDADLGISASSVELSRSGAAEKPKTAIISAATVGFTGHRWTLKDEPVVTVASYTFDSVSRSNGDYTVILLVNKDGVPRSTEIVITVIN
jgi:hypothetical protein